MNTNQTDARIKALREIMMKRGIDATIIPQTDPHQGEYLADHWQTRRWLSGFTGSAGDLVVTHDNAYIWADSRYWLQAARQLDGTCIGVMEDGKTETPSIAGWLCQTLPAGATVGINGMTFSINAARHLNTSLSAAGISLNVDFDPIDLLWTDRPSLPKTKAFIHEDKYAGETAQSKIARVLDNVNASGAEAAFISDLAEIAWILNLRSADVECNPVVTSFLLLAPQGSTLFIDPDKLTPEITGHLSACGVATAPYSSTAESLAHLPENLTILVSGSQTGIAIHSRLGNRAIIGPSPAAMLKAVKNPTQIAGVRQAMIRDGIALVHSFMEIEKRMGNNIPTTEIDVADILRKHRSANPMFFDLSFDTIAGFGPHGAIVHYSATGESNATLSPDNLLLVDSGANYFDGTTDITRTIALGTPTEAQKHDFTLVMKGHIAIAQAIYPEGTRGAQLDALARINLWKEGLSYLHGTGHGVGHFLNVHEGPQSIRLNDTLAPLTPGMITSNEPGLYREGLYGIRCENLVLTQKETSTEFGNFYSFETLTLFPFDLSLFDTSIMTDSEISWINDYHGLVRSKLSPELDETARQWLTEKTRPLTR